ncbi:ClpX C4-type zinc finger protein [bacterium]|nr:ClpX C4-type zinc finger protein [bacterium]
MSDSEKIVSLKSARKKTKENKTSPAPVKKEQNQAVEPVYCSFCGRPNTQVVKMVQGPGVNICSECTMIAVQYLILEDKLPSNEAQKILDIFWSKIK